MDANPWGPIGAQLIQLSRDLGAEHRDLAILGEGNTSARLGAERFLVKASGSHLGTLTEGDLVECRFAPLLELMERSGVTDADVDAALMDCRVESAAKRPSVEALFHAYLLSLPGIQFVGHTHPVAVNAILCSGRAAEFAGRRIFPDEIVCCGPESVLVPYSDPGVWLAQAMRDGVESHRTRHGGVPRVILLKNHGLVSLGASVPSVWAGTTMAVKAARIFAGSCALGGPDFLEAGVVDRILNRSDEHYRQRALRL